MTAYPSNIATDLDLQRIDNNLTELGGDSINSLIDEVIAIETALGNPIGVCGDLESRLAVSIGDDGYLKPAAISAVGLISLPITAAMFNDYTIPETKLVLDHSTISLYSALQSALASITAVSANFSALDTQFYGHVLGIAFGSDDVGRHVASHIDINDGFTNGYPRYVGKDFRDLAYYNDGLVGLDGYIRSAKTVMDALIQINNDFVLHALSLDGYHNASFVNLDTTNFIMIPSAYNTVQKAIEYLDNFEGTVVEDHRFVQHANGIPNYSKVYGYALADGYNNYFGPFGCSTTIDTDTKLSYVDFATVADQQLDWAFAQIAVGDKIRINYGGFLSSFSIENVEYVPQTTFRIYIDGYHPAVTTQASAILEKSNYDENHYGELAVCLADHNYYYVGGLSNAKVPGSAIVVKPNAASVLGMEVALDQLDTTHYNLYVGFYPTGNPAESAIQFPQIAAIDVTGNLGKTPGQYTLKQIVNNINKKFRSGGYNFRLVAFEYKGCLGLAIPEVIDNAGFSIISGVATLGTVAASTFVNNVIDVVHITKDPFGFGSMKANVASPKYTGTTDSYIPTQVFLPKIGKKYSINGQFTDVLAPGFDTESGSYYNALFVERRLDSSGTRFIGVYKVEKTLEDSKLQPGSTIVINPAFAITDSRYNKNDYGRFIVEKIDHFCGDGYTYIEVVNCVSLFGNALLNATDPGTRIGDPTVWLPVKMYYSDDSISLSPTVPNGVVDYKRYFEFYIKKDGKTFAHERARMPLQSPIGSLLDTTVATSFTVPPTNPSGALNSGWHIVDVSPRLRGFFTVGGADQKKYIRFVAQNYYVGDDSFEGYICQRDTAASITINAGPIVRVSKGDVGRYYDNTGIDYIDIKFDKSFIDSDNLQYENTLPVGAATSHYVDIEIFSTLRSNEEYMCLGSCEQLTATNNRSSVWNFNDLRQFGTLSEKNLTTSAINFIESGDKWLHHNGVINGFDFITSGSDFFTFNGGTAIVNGKIVNKNDFVVYPYNIYVHGNTTDTIEFAVCITESGSTELVVIDSTTGIQEYDYSSAITDTGFFKVYNISQLIRVRKDLLPIYIISIDTADTGIFTISVDPYDIRKFVKNTDVKNDLVLCGGVSFEKDIPYNELGHFNTWEALSNYVKYFTDSQTTVLVRGTTTISQTVDFDNKPVTLIGDKSNIVYVEDLVAVGINISSNMEIRGLNFVSKYNIGDTANTYNEGKATIGVVLTSGATVVKNVIIKDCTFNHLAGTRASGISHILFEQTGDGGIFENITIENNIFLEEKTQLCITFANIHGVAATVDNFDVATGTIANSITISNNKGNFGSWILLSSDNHTSGANSRGLSGYNVKIINNTFDHIFYHLSKSISNSYNGTTFNNIGNSAYPSLNSGVFIARNTCISIQNRVIAIVGVYTANYDSIIGYYVNVAAAPVIISENNCSNIQASVDGDIEVGSFVVNYPTYSNITYARSPSPVIISNNILTSSIYEPTYFTPIEAALAVVPPATPYSDSAITVCGNVASSGIRENVCTISGNIINYGLNYKDNTSADKYQYSFGIISTVPCSIENNRISKCIKYSHVWLRYDVASSANDGNDIVAKICNNILERGLKDISSYVEIDGGVLIDKITITDNVFDKQYVDNAQLDSDLIKVDTGFEYKIIAQRNVNQIFIADGFEFVKVNKKRERTGTTVPNFQWEIYYRSTSTVILPTVVVDLELTSSPDTFKEFFYISIPSIEGALPVEVSFDLKALIDSSAYRLVAYTQVQNIINTGNIIERSVAVYDGTGTAWKAPDYVADPPTGISDGTYVTHKINLESANVRYSNYTSANRGLTLVIGVCNSDLSYLSIPITGGGAFSTYIYINNLNVVYRY